MTRNSNGTVILDTISDFLVKFCRRIDKDGRDLCIYQIGSSLCGVKPRIHDVDLLLVRPDSQQEIHKTALINLRDKMLAGQALSGAFDATDAKTKKSLAAAAGECKLCDETELVMQCRIGPIPQPQTHRPTIYIHICGPLTRADNQTFFDLLPFHGLAFVALNRCLRGCVLSEVVTPPRPSRRDLDRWNDTIGCRIMAADSTEALMKGLRKLFLNCLLFKGVAMPYTVAEEMISVIEGDADFPRENPASVLKYVEASFPSIQYRSRLY